MVRPASSGMSLAARGAIGSSGMHFTRNTQALATPEHARLCAFVEERELPPDPRLYQTHHQDMSKCAEASLRSNPVCRVFQYSLIERNASFRGWLCVNRYDNHLAGVFTVVE